MEMTEKQIENIREYLENNDEQRLDVCRDINSYDGSMDEFNTWDIEDLCEFSNTYEIARAIIYGDVTNVSDNVRCDVYGNLENVTQSDLEDESRDYIDDIITFIEDNDKDELESIFTDDIFSDILSVLDKTDEED